MRLAGLSDVINAGRQVTGARVYNGFNWEERKATNAPQRTHRYKLGNNPTVCSMTGFSDPSQPSDRGYIFTHNEDYARPIWTHAISRRTHQKLHARFHTPRDWFNLVAEYYVHGAWFTFLSMNPLLQWPNAARRPFWSIYPSGLPLADEMWPDYADQIGLSRDLFLSSDLRDPIRLLWKLPAFVSPDRSDVVARVRVRK